MSSSGLPEEEFGLLLVEHQKPPLDGADGRLRHIAICLGKLACAVGDERNDGAQIAQIHERQLLICGNPECDGQNAFLCLVQLHKPCEKHRSQRADRRPDRVALLAEQIPEDGGVGFIGVILEFNVACAFFKKRFRLALCGDTGEVALDVGGENGNAVAREALGKNLQRHGLPRSGRARDEPVPVGQLEREHLRLHALARENSGAGVCAHAASEDCSRLNTRGYACKQGSRASPALG